ncbi:MAG: hypothetical protein HY791_24265 [Deltaproteobacteria bacterium]|nr:hypothetical protein [Deltaproteobacteria bacterium]
MTRFFLISSRNAAAAIALACSSVGLAQEPAKPAEPAPGGAAPAPAAPGGAAPAAAPGAPATPAAPAKPETKPAGQAVAEPVVEKLSHGQVDWSSKVLRITGSGAPNAKLPNVAAIRLNAERAAKLAAYRNVIEALKGIRVTDRELAGGRLGQSLVRGQVEGIVQSCKAVDTRYFSDGGVDVEIECPLDGALSYAIAPPKDYQALEEAGEKKYSGLIIDVSGVAPAFAIAPRLLAGEKVVYAQEAVKTKFLRKHGSVAFFKTEDDAKASQRVGTAPLVVKGTPIVGSADVSIAPEDAAKIEAANRTYLSEGRVAVVVGK